MTIITVRKIFNKLAIVNPNVKKEAYSLFRCLESVSQV